MQQKPVVTPLARYGHIKLVGGFEKFDIEAFPHNSYGRLIQQVNFELKDFLPCLQKRICTHSEP